MMDTFSDLPPILENAPDVVYAFDAEGRILSLNKAVEAILGYAREEMLGQSVFSYIHPEDHERIRTGMEESIRARALSLANAASSSSVSHVPSWATVVMPSSLP